MKKILSVMLMFILLMSLMIPAYADSEAKEVEAAVSASATKVNIGESVELSAVVPKHGSTFTDSWSLAEKVGTILDEDSESYISTAVFKAVEPGKYTIEYNITMQAGKSNVVFVGKGSVTIEVTGEITVVGAEIIVTSFKSVLNNYGSTLYYKAEGKKYAVWSNGKRLYCGFISFNFGINDTFRDVNVTLNTTSGVYSYWVKVKWEDVSGLLF